MSFSVSEILSWTGGRLANETELGARASEIRVEKPAQLGQAREKDLAFFFNKNYQPELLQASPGILITAEPFVKPLLASGLPWIARAAIIACADPYLQMARLSEKFGDRISSVAHVPNPETRRAPAQVHPTAVVDSDVVLGEGVRIGAHCVIEAGTRIGAGTVIYPGSYVGPRCVIGNDCTIFPNVSLYEWTELGDRVRIHAGSVLGSDGFGYAPKLDGSQVTGHQKIYHLGRVVVGNDAEIGANSCIDRSTFGETRIGTQAKLDNLVHVGHNAQVDDGAVICGGTCLAGRAKVGKFAYVGGLTGIVNDVAVGDGAKVGALALVTKDVPAGGTAVGNPQREYREHFKAHAMLSRLLDKKRD